jgi:zinc and cadmium transporter
VNARLVWILATGFAQSCIALVGAVTLLLPERGLKRLLLPLVALSAGALMGGALFHMLPAGVERLHDSVVPYVWVAVGFAAFFCIEQFLHWHHCHQPTHDHKQPLSYMLLVAGGVHHLLAGIAVGASFMVDIRLGIATWLAAAAHEVPQELGDFGVLVHAGFSPRRALAYNFLSALTFPIGALLAYFTARQLDVSFLLPFAAGNFLYIGAVDLVPEVNKHRGLGTGALHFACFVAGLGALLALALVLHH